jgi:hypothetical protein
VYFSSTSTYHIFLVNRTAKATVICEDWAPYKSYVPWLGRQSVAPISWASVLQWLISCLIEVACLWNMRSFLLFQSSQQQRIIKVSKWVARIWLGLASLCVSDAVVILFVWTLIKSQKTLAKGHSNIICVLFRSHVNRLRMYCHQLSFSWTGFLCTECDCWEGIRRRIAPLLNRFF